MIGNTLLKGDNNYITLTTVEDGIPVHFRIYDISGNELFYQVYPNMINLSFSENKRYIVFSTGINSIVFDLNNFSAIGHPKSNVFSVTNLGAIVLANTENYLIYT